MCVVVDPASPQTVKNCFFLKAWFWTTENLNVQISTPERNVTVGLLWTLLQSENFHFSGDIFYTFWNRHMLRVKSGGIELTVCLSRECVQGELYLHSVSIYFLHSIPTLWKQGRNRRGLWEFLPTVCMFVCVCETESSAMKQWPKALS